MILFINENHLCLGPNLPQRCQFGSMVTLPMGKEALLIGCSDTPSESTATDKIFKLSWQGGYLNWITIEKKLKFPRTNAVVMLLPGTHCRSPISLYINSKI